MVGNQDQIIKIYWQYVQIVIIKNIIDFKEKKVIEYKEVFEVDAEEKAKEILSATYKNKPVAELVKETIKDKVVITTDKVPSQVKQGTKKENIKQETK